MNKGQKISEVDLILSKQLKLCPWLSTGLGTSGDGDGDAHGMSWYDANL